MTAPRPGPDAARVHAAEALPTAHWTAMHSTRTSTESSLSLSSAGTVKRSASLASSTASPSRPPVAPPVPPAEDERQPESARKLRKRRGSWAHRRSSSAAHADHDIREGLGNLNRWSHSSTASSRASVAREVLAGTHSTRLSFGGGPPLDPPHGSAIHSPSRTSPARNRSPDVSPRGKTRPYSPPPQIPTPGPAPALPLLPATAFDPISPLTAATTATPPSAGLFTPANPTSGPDYFSSRPFGSTTKPAPPKGQPSKAPLASPPIFDPPTDRPNKPLHAASTSASVSRSRQPSVDQQGAESALGRGRRGSARDQPRSVVTRDRSVSAATENPEDDSRRTGEKDKKTMLSRALQKANTAVLLDNAQNFEGAVEAYGDACRLLQQVMLRSTGEEDRRKLEAIRVTYTNRIQELRLLDPAWQSSGGKSLPARPMSDQSLAETQSFIDDFVEDEEEPVVIETATITRIVNDKSIEPAQHDVRKQARESVLTSAIREVESAIPKPSNDFLLQPPPEKLATNVRVAERSNLDSPMDKSYMPPPLSPRRPTTPNASADPFDEPSVKKAMEQRANGQDGDDERMNGTESMSWLDTIDESGGSSCSSSVHSLAMGALRRKHLRTGSGATEAEFDAALDAAVEAAYDDSMEPFEDEGPISPYRKNVELAKERVREAEREMAIEAARRHDRDMRTRADSLPHVRDGSVDLGVQNEEADDEERILDEMTKDYMLDDFDFGLQSKSALPRQSDSSTFSGSTWHSSISSARNTAGTSLSTVAEADASPKSATTQKASHQFPLQAPGALPPVSEAEPQTDIPPTATEGPSHGDGAAGGASSVRSRRLSGQHAKQLKIETSMPTNGQEPLTQQPYTLKVDETPVMPKTANASLNGQALSAASSKLPGASISQSNLQAPTTNSAGVSPADSMPSISPSTSFSQILANDGVPSDHSGRVPSKNAAAVPPLKKNKSSLSLRNRQLSVSSPDGSDGSVGTPLSTTFTTFTQRKTSNTQQVSQTPGIPTFALDGMGMPTGGMHLFEADIHSPSSPGTPNPLAINAPIPLEPCPEAYLLRPFWLMRCFYQTLAHPRGGYLSTKLFVPRDIWNVKGVKIKAVEEKISNCDYLSAALLKLSSVDTFDADAVLEEMQALELILDQVQSNLIKKLGSDVGTNGVSSMFKDAQTVGLTSPDGSTAPELPSRMGGSRSYLSSWKKLRSKNSGVNLANNFTAPKEVSKDSLTMSTLPMTSMPDVRIAKREVNQVEFTGPNANYMSALAKLFDAVQILDQIARQVEDPGLKHSSPTHVGLELSTRHAAEFFGFYICRFVLTDVAIMLDKFIKRGSEWVLV